MNPLLVLPIITLSLCGTVLKAQVPVREEPRHHPVLQNKYIRLLDVWLPPGDTSLFHIHATPSLFVELSDGELGSQIKGKGWANDKAIAGKTWYRSFLHDTLIHRVCNPGTIPVHVNDIEILSSYHSKEEKLNALPFKLIFENETAFAYQPGNIFSRRQIIKSRGPIIVEVISGKGINFHNTVTKKSTTIKEGAFLYVEPNSTFYFSKSVKAESNMIIFELK
jgi:hypothetical protein